MKTNLKWKLQIAAFWLIPLALLASWPLSEWYNRVQDEQVVVHLSPPVKVDAPPVRIEGQPLRVRVPGQNIDLAVINGYYTPSNGQWTLSNDKAQFATITTSPNNQAGNTFIYGHDLPVVFRRLADVKKGDLAEIVTSNGKKFIYKYRSTVIVSPRNTQVFAYAGPPILTLQTCNGIWSQNRALLTFDFVKVVGA